MIQHRNKETDYLLVEVPEGSYGYFINNVGCIRYSQMQGRYEVSSCIEPEQMGIYLEIDKWQLVGLASDLDEKQWKGIVDVVPATANYPACYPGYEALGEWFATAPESGHSLLSSYKLKLETTLVIKKIK